MKRSLRRIALGFVPAMIAALVLWAPAASPVGLQNVNLTCNDGTNLALTLDAAEVAQLADAVAAVNLYPAGDPALTCSLTQSAGLSTGTATFTDSASGNGPHDFAVGGGEIMTGCGPLHFSFSAHGPADSTTANPPGTGTPTSGGTFNLSLPATSICGAGHLVSKPDCLQVGAQGPGAAQLTAAVTKVSGSLTTAFGFVVGSELEADILDSTPDMLGIFQTAACNFDGFIPSAVVTQGNIKVHDA